MYHFLLSVVHPVVFILEIRYIRGRESSRRGMIADSAKGRGNLLNFNHETVKPETVCFSAL